MSNRSVECHTFSPVFLASIAFAKRYRRLCRSKEQVNRSMFLLFFSFVFLLLYLMGKRETVGNLLCVSSYVYDKDVKYFS